MTQDKPTAVRRAWAAAQNLAGAWHVAEAAWTIAQALAPAHAAEAAAWAQGLGHVILAAIT